MISQANISPNTPLGANLVYRGGATFRAWAPLRVAEYRAISAVLLRISARWGRSG
jgi:hypothetical protein